MKIEHTDKVTILLAALSERYNSIHLIRARVENTGVWVIGLSLGAGGWLLQSNVDFTIWHRCLLIVGVLLGLGALRYRYLSDLRKGFSAQQRAAARLEETLGLYTPSLFDEREDPIYPVRWKDAGAENSEGKFFQSSFLLIYLAAAFVCASVVAAGCV